MKLFNTADSTRNTGKKSEMYSRFVSSTYLVPRGTKVIEVSFPGYRQSFLLSPHEVEGEGHSLSSFSLLH